LAETGALVAAVKGVGYAARLAASGIETPVLRREEEARGLTRDLILSAALTLPVFALEMGSHLIPAVHHWVMATIGQGASWLIQFVLTTLVLAGPGRRFFLRGIPTLVKGAPDMSSLVAVGSGAAWGYSTLATFVPALLPPGTVVVYFEAAAVIVTLILLGRLLEARAKGRSSQAIARLVALQPAVATCVRATSWNCVPANACRWMGGLSRAAAGSTKAWSRASRCPSRSTLGML
jgi:cation transport ATPase